MKLKVYGAMTHLLGPQARAVAAVTSQKQFASLMKTSVSYISDYAAETGNEEELKVTFSKVGVLFILCPVCKKWTEYNNS